MPLGVGQAVLLLLLTAAVVAMLTRRISLPYNVGLVAAGMVLTLLPLTPKISLTKDLLYSTLLPPLLFEAALYLRWKDLRREFPIILVLATAGVVLSGAVTASGMHFVAHWPWESALVFGALIAATDPVSVIATLREARVHGRLRLLIESESLFNDATAAVAFSVAVAIATGHSMSSVDVGLALLTTTVGAVLVGAVVGALALFLVGRTEDHLVELTFTMVAAYGSFLLAEAFHFSGVFATIAAGLVMGNWTPLGSISNRGREVVQDFWEFAAFVANSLVFLLIGMREITQDFGAVWVAAWVAIFFVVLGRAAVVYPLCLAFFRSGLRVSMAHQNALFWGGLRGALALALALGLPHEMPDRTEIIAVSFGVVAFSVFVQGLTMTPLLRWIGEVPMARHPGVLDRREGA